MYTYTPSIQQPKCTCLPSYLVRHLLTYSVISWYVQNGMFAADRLVTFDQYITIFVCAPHIISITSTENKKSKCVIKQHVSYNHEHSDRYLFCQLSSPSQQEERGDNLCELLQIIKLRHHDHTPRIVAKSRRIRIYCTPIWWFLCSETHLHLLNFGGTTLKPGCKVRNLPL